MPQLVRCAPAPPGSKRNAPLRHHLVIEAAAQRRRGDHLLCWAGPGGKGHRRRTGKPGNERRGIKRVFIFVLGQLVHDSFCVGLFEVKDLSPPPKVLGIHSLPPDTHNGDQIEVEGQVCLSVCSLLIKSHSAVLSLSLTIQDYIVDSVTLHYKLVGGKYQRDHNQLAVHSTSRFFLNKYLDHMYKQGQK